MPNAWASRPAGDAQFSAYTLQVECHGGDRRVLSMREIEALDNQLYVGLEGIVNVGSRMRQVVERRLHTVGSH